MRLGREIEFLESKNVSLECEYEVLRRVAYFFCVPVVELTQAQSGQSSFLDIVKYSNTDVILCLYLVLQNAKCIRLGSEFSTSNSSSK